LPENSPSARRDVRSRHSAMCFFLSKNVTELVVARWRRPPRAVRRAAAAPVGRSAASPHDRAITVTCSSGSIEPRSSAPLST
jgi:hypothetical protein